MCGRFVLTATTETIQQTFDLETVPTSMLPRYNIAPTQPVGVITNDHPRQLTFQRWGLIPSWSKDPSIGSTLINARAETVEEKPAFRTAFKRRRCLIPADGFYEWQKRGKEKAPIFVHLKERELFAFAGLWEVWHSPDGSEVQTCTILTTEPNAMMSEFHHRMAVILPREDYSVWLDKDAPPDILKALLKPYDENKMAYYEVSKIVNSPYNDNADCIVPLSTPPAQQSLL
jgi:putative SOS response-associated peptidase YedK